MANPERVSKSLRYPGKESVQTLVGSGSRVNATGTAASTAEAALPTGARVIEMRAVGNVWIRFGNTGLGAAAADADSILFPAGERPFVVPVDASQVPYTHFRVMRHAGETDDVSVQIERVEVQ